MLRVMRGAALAAEQQAQQQQQQQQQVPAEMLQQLLVLRTEYLYQQHHGRHFMLGPVSTCIQVSNRFGEDMAFCTKNIIQPVSTCIQMRRLIKYLEVDSCFPLEFTFEAKGKTRSTRMVAAAAAAASWQALHAGACVNMHPGEAKTGNMAFSYRLFYMALPHDAFSSSSSSMVASLDAGACVNMHSGEQPIWYGHLTANNLV
jgi:hypothetical protein